MAGTVAGFPAAGLHSAFDSPQLTNSRDALFFNDWTLLEIAEKFDIFDVYDLRRSENDDDAECTSQHEEELSERSWSPSSATSSLSARSLHYFPPISTLCMNFWAQSLKCKDVMA